MKNAGEGFDVPQSQKNTSARSGWDTVNERVFEVYKAGRLAPQFQPSALRRPFGLSRLS
jgi:hypothetical protein